MAGQGGRDRLDGETLTAESQAGYRKERGGGKKKKQAFTYLYIKVVTLPCKFAKAHL